MKTTGECLSAETIEAGCGLERLKGTWWKAAGKTHTAFVFIKPHAVYEKAGKGPGCKPGCNAMR